MSHTCVLRVWIPDRPGALGALASRVGAVGGDLLAIDILERGAGRAVDELTIELPDADRVELLVAEVLQVDGVDVESVRPTEARIADATVAVLEAAAEIAECTTVDDALAMVAQRSLELVGASWSVVIDLASGVVRTSVGEPPPDAWIVAFVQGTLVAGGHEVTSATSDVLGAELPRLGAWLVLGREGRDLRWRERSEVAGLARITDASIRP